MVNEGEQIAQADDEEVVEIASDDAPATEAQKEVEAKARKMGWSEKSEFKGDPAKWRPADEFVERGENMLPLLRSQVKKQDRQIADLTRTVQEFAEYASKTEARAMEKALTQLRQERADAIAKGDGVAFDKVDAQIETLRKKAEAPAPKQQDNGEDPVFNEWISRNKWAEDKKLQKVGRAIAEALVDEGETATGTDLLDLVTKEIKVRYPEKFENPRRNAAPTVEGGAAPRKSGGKGFADMAPDARAACERMAKNGFPDDAKKQAEFKAGYVKNYHAEA